MRRRTKYKEDYMQYIEVSYFDKLPGNLNESLFVSLSVYLVLEQEKIFQLQLGRLTLIKNIYYWHWCFSQVMSNLYIHFIVSFPRWSTRILFRMKSGQKPPSIFPYVKNAITWIAYCITKPSIFFWFVWLFCNEI